MDGLGQRKKEFGQARPARYIIIVDLNLFIFNNLMFFIKKLKVTLGLII